MLQCWQLVPETRPLFDQLEDSISKLIEKDIAKHYTDLNDPYLKENARNLDGKTDYLALLGSPDSQAPCAPTTSNSTNGHLIGMPETTDKCNETSKLMEEIPMQELNNQANRHNQSPTNS